MWFGSPESIDSSLFLGPFCPKCVLWRGRRSMGNLPGTTRLQFSPKTNHMESPKPLKTITNSVWGLRNPLTAPCFSDDFDQSAYFGEAEGQWATFRARLGYNFPRRPTTWRVQNHLKQSPIMCGVSGIH